MDLELELTRPCSHTLLNFGVKDKMEDIGQYPIKLSIRMSYNKGQYQLTSRHSSDPSSRLSAIQGERDFDYCTTQLNVVSCNRLGALKPIIKSFIHLQFSD